MARTRAFFRASETVGFWPEAKLKPQRQKIPIAAAILVMDASSTGDPGAGNAEAYSSLSYS